MAFGRRSTVAGTGAPVGTTGPRSRGWRNMGRGRRGAASTIASNKAVGGPKTKLTDMRAASTRRFSVAGATIGEKFARLGADMKLGLYTISHPIHPLRRAAAKERAVNVKAAATERKRQKVARAVDVEMRKRAMVREGRAARLQTAL
ncbi:hypothetical protein M758_8G012500 [Ceratodon purpureus]|uniref:Uncharacterized protein n=1 Tax=Ceratodon purpureus TaxID=3225 RepID=A0A8T0GU24_CERPU|nr:hypothetical protein KC19_8G013100 [Ceratodon purpureus]KAG0563220.1 hypothetical protein KC19_8G013100 [Ceratodon purpureus]KAG0563221.1 hypothetical protein KC19_8G013100 [Ceratodon purpureus]KAG0607242.1 hypothetical protein M758_8G012500 [Ceratodon purpureus]KAG0607243.1 hypothetical protein M758_8G012500 [Ceratodon purpureus]